MAVSGRGSNLEALATACAGRSDIELSAVISDREAPALQLARNSGIPAVRLEDPADAALWLKVLADSGAELLVLAGYLRLVPAEVVAMYSGRIINIHPALLPRHGGPGMYGSRVHRAVLEAGDSESGATVHLVDEVYDRGRILGQARLQVLPTDSPESLARRVLALEHRLLPEAVLAAARAGQPVPFELN